MKLALLALLLILGAVPACVHPRVEQSYVVTDVIPAGSHVEFFGQINDNRWLPTMEIKHLPRPMPIKEAQHWALSAAQQRLGPMWKDYKFRVSSPNKKAPAIVWQRYFYAET